MIETKKKICRTNDKFNLKLVRIESIYNLYNDDKNDVYLRSYSYIKYTQRVNQWPFVCVCFLSNNRILFSPLIPTPILLAHLTQWKNESSATRIHTLRYRHNGEHNAMKEVSSNSGHTWLRK